MTSRRTKEKRDAKYIDGAKWIRAMSDCLDAFRREQVGSPCPVVDDEVIADFGGSADDMFVWLICRTREEKSIFSDTMRSRSISAIKKKMLAVGFPDSAVASLTVRVTSREEVEEGGGRFSYFR